MSKVAEVYRLNHIIRPDGPKGSQHCAFCGKVFKPASSTGTLRYHLRTCVKAPSDVAIRYMESPAEPSQSVLNDAGVAVPPMSEAARKKSEEVCDAFFLNYAAPLSLIGMLVVTFIQAPFLRLAFSLGSIKRRERILSSAATGSCSVSIFE